MPNVLLGITGGIAAYKTPNLVRTLQKQGSSVSVAITPAALNFLALDVLKILCDGNVLCDIFESESDGVGHIDLADWADIMLVAPATANSIAKFAHGLADDAVSVSYLAATCPKIVAPAMNSNMWRADVTQQNLNLLRSNNVVIVPPDEGELACGWTGPGRMPDESILVEKTMSILSTGSSKLTTPPDPGALQGKNILITAGPTREHVDPVRYLSNPSSGKMGYALAQQAAAAGAQQVTLVSGPTDLADIPGVKTIRVVSAADMLDAVNQAIAAVKPDIFIAAAAVADYRPATISDQKIKKDDTSGLDSIAMERTVDILKSVSERKAAGVVVGFAAESENVVDNARKKLVDKGLDLVVANNICEAGAGFGGDQNHVWLVDGDGEIELKPASKTEIAEQILNKIIERVQN